MIERYVKKAQEIYDAMNTIENLLDQSFAENGSLRRRVEELEHKVTVLSASDKETARKLKIADIAIHQMETDENYKKLILALMQSA